MDVNFCEKCDMKLDYYIEEQDEGHESNSGEPKLYLGCKVCGNKQEHQGDACIYNNDYKIDLSQIINQNKFLEEDITLPSIQNNQNIKCPNKECISIKEKRPSDILYIKYDYESMKFSYICKYCKQSWINQ